MYEMVDRIRYPTISYLPFRTNYYILSFFFLFTFLKIIPLDTNILQKRTYSQTWHEGLGFLGPPRENGPRKGAAGHHQ